MINAIALVVSYFSGPMLTPWNVCNNPAIIHYTLYILGAFIGPLFGIPISDFYSTQKQIIHVPDPYAMNQQGRYWYQGGY